MGTKTEIFELINQLPLNEVPKVTKIIELLNSAPTEEKSRIFRI